jgi:hypothetical protein
VSDLAEDDAATPLTPEERAQLIPTYITLRRELNEAEQIGIADADRWALAAGATSWTRRFSERCTDACSGRSGAGLASSVRRPATSASRPGG